MRSCVSRMWLAELVLAGLGRSFSNSSCVRRAALVLHRQEGEAVTAALCAATCHAELLGLVAELRQRALSSRLGLFLQGLDAVANALALEHRADRASTSSSTGNAPGRRVTRPRPPEQAQQPQLGCVSEVPLRSTSPPERIAAAAARPRAGGCLSAWLTLRRGSPSTKVCSPGADVEAEPDRIDRAAVDAGSRVRSSSAEDSTPSDAGSQQATRLSTGNRDQRRERSGHGLTLPRGSHAAHLTPGVWWRTERGRGHRGRAMREGAPGGEFGRRQAPLQGRSLLPARNDRFCRSPAGPSRSPHGDEEAVGPSTPALTSARWLASGVQRTSMRAGEVSAFAALAQVGGFGGIPPAR